VESTARDHTIEPAPADDRIRLHVVAGPEQSDEATNAEEPDVWRSAAVGAVIGFLVATIAVTAAGLAGGLETGSAVGLGIFVGMWSGVGFGFMMGATVPLARHLDAVNRPIDQRPIDHGPIDHRQGAHE
jgi:hypothetical protein